MPSIDLPLPELWAYRPRDSEPSDFDGYWRSVVSEARGGQLNVMLTPAGPAMAGVSAYEVSFTSLGGAPVTGWYVRPVGDGPWPGVAQYHGYSNRANRPLQMYTLAAQGIAVLSMDCRGQMGGSPDVPPLDGGHHAGWLTRGLSSPDVHYYRYVFADAVRALDVLASFDEVDERWLATMGKSQGGALALAAGALAGRAIFTWADVPFLCDIRRAVDLAPEEPYTEVAAYLKAYPALAEQAFSTLSYFDLVNHARRLRCPARVTVGLWDDICPPSGIFGMFSQLAAEDKELVVMPYTGHEVPYDVEVRCFTEVVSRLGVGQH